jgi:hypothetical protein
LSPPATPIHLPINNPARDPTSSAK